MKKSEMSDPTIPVPAGTYALYVTDVRAKTSKVKPDGRGGNPMLEIDLQILAPESAPSAAGSVKTAGRTVKTHRITFTDGNLLPIKDVEALLGKVFGNDEDIDVQADCIAPIVALKGTCFEGDVKSVPYYEHPNNDYKLAPLTNPDGTPKIKGYSAELAKVLTPLQPLPSDMSRPA